MRPALLLLFPALLSCGGFLKTGKQCGGGVGLTATGYNGTGMPDGQVALSFDGSPSDLTMALDQALAGRGVQATFFVTGERLQAHGGDLQTLKNHGHLIGNHTYSDADLAASGDPVTAVRQTDAMLLPYVTGNMFLLRAPGAGLSDALAQRLNDAGLSRYVGDVRWDIGDGVTASDAACWDAGTSVADCAQGYMTALATRRHGILQLHDGTQQTVDLLGALLAALSAGGYQVVRLDAVPAINVALTQSGGTPGATGGPAGCDEY